MSTNEVAFFIGLFGSVHCVGMCGPLAFAVPFTGRSRWLLVWDKFIYQIGRTISYSLLGLITGIIGKQLWLFGAQQSISIISGVLIIGLACSKLLNLHYLKTERLSGFPSLINKFIIRAVTQKNGHLYIGILNGLLPCGFVYLALIGAVNTSTVISSVQYMFWFGIGTLPLMLAATLGAGLLTVTVRNRLNKTVPYFMLCLGLWFVLRGVPLNIPFISPAEIADPALCR
ncbi:sulfite exporter TauE/SafE family protein [Mucilaginibacter gynuensis]|uniref:Sulfite exporter TauE/SafE family protein n=1 Tax=Mucilaginibacter gynuensis TaxID=1302236 RepID=A0ABP8FSA5_9SPHI